MNHRVVLNETLQRMLRERETIDLQGRSLHVTGGVSTEEAECICSLILERRCRRCIETGVAYGVSTLAICQALSLLGEGGRLYGVDPCQYSEHGGAPLLGFQHLCIKAHGKSGAKAIRNAVRFTLKSIKDEVCGKIHASVKDFNQKQPLIE